MKKTPSSLTPRWQAFSADLRARFQALAPREQTAVRLGALALAVLLVWLIAVQPAWRTLRQTPAQLDQVEQALQEMQSLAAEARELRATPPVPAAQAAEALQAASTHLGAGARLSINGDRAQLTITEIDSTALQAWLGEVRNAARARPVEAKLQRGPRGYTGTLVLALGTAP